MGNIFDVLPRKRIYLEKILKEGYQIVYMLTSMDKTLYIEKDLSKEMSNVFLRVESENYGQFAKETITIYSRYHKLFRI